MAHLVALRREVALAALFGRGDDRDLLDDFEVVNEILGAQLRSFLAIYRS